MAGPVMPATHRPGGSLFRGQPTANALGERLGPAAGYRPTQYDPLVKRASLFNDQLLALQGCSSKIVMFESVEHQLESKFLRGSLPCPDHAASPLRLTNAKRLSCMERAAWLRAHHQGAGGPFRGTSARRQRAQASVDHFLHKVPRA